MYIINYDRQSGNPDSIFDDVAKISFPIDEKNREFIEFLEWNAKQITPLDWKTGVGVHVLTAAENRYRQASKTARAIPSWATWTQAEAEAWATTNIATPLASARTSLPSTLTLATARAAFVVILNILDKMWALQKANAQMTLAIRDEIWPDLPNK